MCWYFSVHAGVCQCVCVCKDVEDVGAHVCDLNDN